MPAIFLAWLGISAIAVVTGPFGSYHDMPFGLRALYWPVVVALSIVLGTLVRGVVELWLGLQDSWQALALVTLGHMLVLALPIWGLARLFTRHRDILLPGPWAFVAYVGMTSLGVGLIRLLLRQWQSLPSVVYPAPVTAEAPADQAKEDRADSGPVIGRDRAAAGSPPAGGALRPQAALRSGDLVLAPDPPVRDSAAPIAPQSNPKPDPQPRLLARLPPGEWGELIRISSANHHVALHMQGGTARLLLRLADALAETAPLSGMQVHRSHWVALAHIRGSARANGRPVLILSDGSLVPISRSYLPAVQARGLIADS